MLLLSSTDVALSVARKNGTLRIEPFTTRFGETWFSVNDDHGMIEVFSTRTEAKIWTQRTRWWSSGKQAPVVS